MEHGFKANFYNKKEEIETGLQDYEEDNGFLASSEQKKTYRSNIKTRRCWMW